MHIATSVINRIMNAADGVGAFAPLPVPSVPEPNPNSAPLDAQLNTPPSGAAPDASVIQNVISDEKTPLETLIQE
jgi:hypothetical protein